MAAKKDVKGAKTKSEDIDTFGKITSESDLKTFLQSILDKMKEDAAPAIYAASAINYALNIPNIYDYLSNTNRELARDIWLRLKQSGFQVRTPPMLFDEDGAAEVV